MYSPTKDKEKLQVKLGKNPKKPIIYGTRIIKNIKNHTEHSK
jgi:hypothetical protein